MIAICERTSIEITLENATNYAVYALLRLFSIIDRFPAVGSFGWVVFGLVLGWVVSAYSDRMIGSD